MTEENAAKKILIAEDDKFLMKVYDVKLKKEGYTVLEASDGEQALVMIKAEKPNLILLDLIMPKKTGFEVLEGLKSDPEIAGIPVVVLSNLGQEEDMQKAMDLGAKDYIVKADISIEDVLVKIKTYL